MNASRPDMRLSLNFPRVFVAGCPSFFEFVLHNASETHLLDLALTINSPLLGLSDHVIKLGALCGFESRHGHVDVVPQDIGTQPIRVLVDAFHERDVLRLTGTCREFEVYARPESPANVSVIVHDIQSHRSHGDKAEFGGMKGDVNIQITDLLRNVQTVNDLLQLRIPDVFHPLRLDAINSPDACEMLSIPEVFLRYFEPADVLELKPGTPPQGDAPHGWRLCSASATLSLGRSTQDADIVTRFLPAGTENNAKSALISRKHALLHINEATGEIHVESLAAHSAIRIGTVQPRAGELTPVPASEVLGIGQALADIRLRCTVRKPLLPRRFRVANLSQWIGDRITQNLSDEGNWGRVELDYLNTTPCFWRTVWFHRYVPVGQGHGNVIEIDTDQMDGTPAYLHHLRGCFWIECASEKKDLIVVEGLPLTEGDLVPLRDGMKLTLGGVEHSVKRVR